MGLPCLRYIIIVMKMSVHLHISGKQACIYNWASLLYFSHSLLFKNRKQKQLFLIMWAH